jgi:hypothetical protein
MGTADDPRTIRTHTYVAVVVGAYPHAQGCSGNNSLALSQCVLRDVKRVRARVCVRVCARADDGLPAARMRTHLVCLKTNVSPCLAVWPRTGHASCGVENAKRHDFGARRGPHRAQRIQHTTTPPPPPPSSPRLSLSTPQCSQGRYQRGGNAIAPMRALLRTLRWAPPWWLPHGRRTRACGQQLAVASFAG